MHLFADTYPISISFIHKCPIHQHSGGSVNLYRICRTHPFVGHLSPCPLVNPRHTCPCHDFSAPGDGSFTTKTTQCRCDSDANEVVPFAFSGLRTPSPVHVLFQEAKRTTWKEYIYLYHLQMSWLFHALHALPCTGEPLLKISGRVPRNIFLKILTLALPTPNIIAHPPIICRCFSLAVHFLQSSDALSVAVKVDGGANNTAAPKGFIEGLKGLVPSRSERKKLVPLAAMFFFILFNYTILRDTKVC